MAFYRVKKTKLWLIKAIDRSSGKSIAWVFGGRDKAKEGQKKMAVKNDKKRYIKRQEILIWEKRK